MRVKVNLNNIKNSLKKEQTDSQIVNFILGLDMIDSVLEEHLKKIKKTGFRGDKEGNLVNRNARDFRNFRKKIFLSKDQIDHFDDFFIREGLENERKLEKIMEKADFKKKLLRNVDEKVNKTKIQEEADDIYVSSLIHQAFENED
jgi:hypothetical protein